MMLAITPLITTIIGAITRHGPKAKANGGAIGGTGAVLLAPFLTPFIAGLTEGASGPIQQLGFVIGAVVIGGGITWFTTWISPKNK